MSNDPGLTDNAIYMEAVTGDGGTHNASGTWWLSPDIELNDRATSPGPQDVAVAAANDVDVRFHWKLGTTLPGGTSNIVVEAWVIKPSVVISPSDPTVSKLIAQDVVSVSGLHPGDSPVTNIKWTPTGAVGAPDGLDPGGVPSHRCLIGRCYPDSLTPDPNAFHVPDDPHVAQHNIAIQSVVTKMERFGFRLTTVNPNREKPELVTVRAVADLQPTKQVLRVLLPRLDRTKGFRQISRAAPHSFGLHLHDFPQAKVRDTTYSLEEAAEESQEHLPPAVKALEDRVEAEIQKRFPGLGEDERQALPAREADIELKPGQVTAFTLNIDLSGSQAGDAHIFHLMQVGPDRITQGGFTLVTVAI